MSVIEINHLTKDYGHGRGVFDVTASVSKGECFGFLGPNGAGKSTTIRHLMGFSKPESGETSVAGLDSWMNSAIIQDNVGYLPGEIALPSGMNGTQFLNMMKKMRKMESNEYMDRLMDIFELNPNIGLKQMSLGTKRKLAVVTAFMHDPDILILDEPTSGLDPIMQETFIEYILEEKKRGKTIFLSSHIFHEVDAACDRIAIIKDGRIVSEFNPDKMKAESDKVFTITAMDSFNAELLKQLPYKNIGFNEKQNSVTLQVEKAQIPEFSQQLANIKILDFREIPFTLEDFFMEFYKEEQTFEEVK